MASLCRLFCSCITDASDQGQQQQQQHHQQHHQQHQYYPPQPQPQYPNQQQPYYPYPPPPVPPPLPPQLPPHLPPQLPPQLPLPPPPPLPPFNEIPLESCEPPIMTRSYVNAVYYPSWLIYKGKAPSCLDVKNITHVFYAFVGVNENGTLRWIDEHADLTAQADGEKGCLAALAKLKRKNPHLRTIVSIGGGASSKEFAALAASRDARQTFAKQARKFCDRYEIDGVDIDWEHPKDAEQGRDYVKLLQACRDELPEWDYFLTTALPVGEYVLKNIDLAAVSRLVNYINIMAYDFVASWTSAAGHHAQLNPPPSDIKSSHPELRACGCNGVDYLLSRGFPSRKLLLGIPSYARYFPKAKALGGSTASSGEMDYCDLPDEWVEDAKVDEAAVAASYVDTRKGKGFVSFDVPRTVRTKARFVTQKSLGGLFYWTGTGDKKGWMSLVAAGKETLGSD